MAQTSIYAKEIEPLKLKNLLLDLDISQGALATFCNVSRPAINLVINRGYVPPKSPSLRGNIESFLASAENVRKVELWLAQNGLKMSDLWNISNEPLRYRHSVESIKRREKTKKYGSSALVPGDPNLIICKETEMVNAEALKHFKIFRNPFVSDVEKSSDIYKSDEHHYIEMAMMDTAKHGGFLAVIGEVGSGKTTMRREVMEHLKKDSNVQVIFPQIIDKGRITAGSICDAIIMDLSEEKPKIRLEQKTRQVQKLLMDRSRAGYQACLILEEAHDLTTQTLKYLKRFYELEDGYKKLLGIILVGQTELKHMFNESQHVEMREVIRRVQVAEIKGLNGHLSDYLTVKFKRVGAKLADIMDDDAVNALSKRLTSDDGRGKKPVSHAYPLLVNNFTARAMNLAFDMGESRITVEVVEAI
jgi:type II secretory pathway predicted ATPase ExeA